MLRVVLVDDEKLARQGMRQLLANHPEVTVVGEASRVPAAHELIQNEKPDAVFLDIQMPGATGFDLLSDLENPPKIVFVTAYSEHAVRAFEVQAVDYLLKPVHPERLAAAVDRLGAICGAKEETTRYNRNDRMCLRTPQRTVITAMDDVIALEADGDFTRFYLSDQSTLLICRTLSSCESTLPDPPFVRLSRSLMINLERLSGVEQISRDEARLSLRGLASQFVVGRRALTRLKKHTA